MSAPLPVIIQGLGPIGLRLAAAAATDPFLELVGAVEIRSEMVDQPLASFVPGVHQDLMIRQSVAQARVDALAQGGILLHCTGSYLEQVSPQIEEALRQDLHVVSTCEELAFAQHSHPEIAAGLDLLARRADRTVVGAGVNPGFLMDALPASLSSISHSIRRVRVERVQNPRRRRVPFQQKVGLDFTRQQWEARRDAGGFGHVGLYESARLLAYALGWKLIDWQHAMDPIQPDAEGLVQGTLETLRGATYDGHVVELHFEANGATPEEYDQIEVDGTPPLKLRFEGGVFGDDATIASVLRAARVIPHTRRGLATVLDLPLR